MPHTTTHSRFTINDNIQGIFWMVLAGMFFSVMVGLVKLLGGHIPSFEIVFFRSSIQLLVIGGTIWRLGKISLKTNRPLLQGVRTVVAILLININFFAFTKLPVAEVTAIGFSRNLFLALLAVPLLAEKITPHKTIALVVGFIGILFITRPAQGNIDPVMFVALGGAMLGAMMMILIRKLTAADSNIVMMTYPALGIGIATAIPTFIYWVQPTFNEFLLLIAMALVGIIGQWCMIQSFRKGEATAVAPAGYTRIIFATIVGFTFFGELPQALSLAGILIVVSSNILLVFHEGRIEKSLG